jgi:LysR family transcriptional regulator, glycine cleavage system transcriptional activator
MTVRRICPSITELQAFEAAARHGSFTQAAVEMHCTQGAVSRQISSLEQTVGVALFDRTRQGLVLSEAGSTYLQAVRSALAQIEAATVQLLSHGGRGGTLNIAALPTICAKWLIPRLPKFHGKHPEITLNFMPHTQAYDFSRPDLDAAIRFGDGVWPGAQADYLVGREAIVIVPPRYVRERGSRKKFTPQDVLNIGLLHHVSVPHAWSSWFDAVGAKIDNPNIGQRLDQFTLLIQAVCAGIGTAIVPRCLVDDELRAGRVVAPFARGVTLTQGYYLCVPEAKAASPRVGILRSWLIAEAKAAESNQ